MLSRTTPTESVDAVERTLSEDTHEAVPAPRRRDGHHPRSGGARSRGRSPDDRARRSGRVPGDCLQLRQQPRWARHERVRAGTRCPPSPPSSSRCTTARASAQAMYNSLQFDVLATSVRLHRGLPAGEPARAAASTPARLVGTESTGAPADPTSIVSMVRYVQQRYTTDPSRVFVAGLFVRRDDDPGPASHVSRCVRGGSQRSRASPPRASRLSSRPPGTSSQAPWNSDCSGGRIRAHGS